MAQTVWDKPTLEQSSILKQVETDSGDILVVPDGLYRGLSHLVQGIDLIQIIHLPTESKLARNSEVRDAALLDGVQDPGNLGTLLRSAAAAGIAEVFLTSDCADPWSIKSLRAGMGAQFALRIDCACDPINTIGLFKGAVLGTHLTGARSLYGLSLTDAVLWCFGSEGTGLRDSTIEAINTHPKGLFTKIPQSANVESLNVAAAAAICFFEQRRQRLINSQSSSVD